MNESFHVQHALKPTHTAALTDVLSAGKAMELLSPLTLTSFCVNCEIWLQGFIGLMYESSQDKGA
jgi:hypothetical protein